MAFTLTLDQFVLNAYLTATGKVTPPASGSTKYTKLTALANLYTKIWALESDTDWASLRNLYTLSPTVTATDTFALSSTIGRLSSQEGDFVRIFHTDGTSESDYTLVPPDRLYDDGHQLLNGGVTRYDNIGTCAQIKTNLVFSTPFLSTSPQFGGTIKVPGYDIPATLTNATDVVSVDDPFWLVFRCAAEYVRNDITRVQLYGSLLDQANDRMGSMKSNNETQSETAHTGAWSPLGQSW